jgi:hypothetical protein
MERNRIANLATRLDRIKLYFLIPLIIIDLIIHGDDWSEYYDSDPLWQSFMVEDEQLR